jgi:hypothetical protein
LKPIGLSLLRREDGNRRIPVNELYESKLCQQYAALPRLAGLWASPGLGIRSTKPQAIEVMAEAARPRLGGPRLIWQLGEAVTQLCAAFERATDATARDFGNFRDR